MHSFKTSLRVGLFALILTLGFRGGARAAETSVARDWKLHPALVQLPAAPVLYALGDVHGDCDRMIELLAGAKLIAPSSNDDVKWTGGNADLIVTGDMIDKFTQSLRVIAVLRRLAPQADAAGGHLVVCLGNHEAEFLAAGGKNKKGAEFEKELAAAAIASQEVAAGHDSQGIGTWMRNLPAGAKVGDWFFCHAGNTAGRKLADLESDLEKGISEQGFASAILSDPNSMLQARMHPRAWFDAVNDASLQDVDRQATPGETKREKKAEAKKAKAAGSAVPTKLTETLTGLGVKHLVIGHQPGKAIFSDGAAREAGEIFQHYDGAFFMIDTGMSRGVTSGRGALLRIESDGPHAIATAIYADGKTTIMWKQ